MMLARFNSRYALFFLPACLDSILCAVANHLTLPPPLSCSLFCSSFLSSYLFIHTGLHPPLLDFLHMARTVLEHEGGSPEDPPALLNPSSLQGHLPGDSSKQIPEQEVQGCDLAICLIPSLFLTFASLISSSL